MLKSVSSTAFGALCALTGASMADSEFAMDPTPFVRFEIPIPAQEPTLTPRVVQVFATAEGEIGSYGIREGSGDPEMDIVMENGCTILIVGGHKILFGCGGGSGGGGTLSTQPTELVFLEKSLSDDGVFNGFDVSVHSLAPPETLAPRFDPSELQSVTAPNLLASQ